MSSLKPPMSLKAWEQTLIGLKNTWNLLSPEQREEALALVQEVQAARMRQPLKFLIPNGAQQKAIREIGQLENFIVVLAFANGVGKTSIVFGILAAIMWGAPTLAFNYPLYTEYPKRWPKLVRIVTESALVSDMGPVQVEAAKWWPKGKYTWIKGGKNHNSAFFTDSGFSGEVMTYEQAVKEFEGKTVALNAYIEPPPKEIYNACVARQRMGGLNIFDMTPLTSAAWVLDDIISKPEIIVDGQVVGRSKCINADIEENCRTHGIDGQLEHSDIQQIISRYDPDEIEARAHGKFMHLSGRIYKDFDRNIHVSKEPLVPPSEGVTIYQAIDPAIGKPIAAIWAYVDPTKTVHIYQEYPSFDFDGAKDSGLGVSDYIIAFRTMEEGTNVAVRIIDRHFGNQRRAMGGPVLKRDFSDAKDENGNEIGMDFIDSYHVADEKNEIETGIFKVKEYLRYNKTKPIDSLNRPRIVISPECRNTIASFDRWSRDPDTRKPKEQYKDFADVVRYLLMSNPEHEVASAPYVRRPAVYGVDNT